MLQVLALVCAAVSVSAAPKYLMFYDYDPQTQANWTNMGFTRVAEQVVQGFPLGFKSLFIVDQYLFYWDSSKRMHLDPSWLQNWQAAWTSTISDLRNYGLIGIFLGDELLLQGLSVADLTSAVNAVRATWPDAILYWNEANRVILKDENNFGEKVHLTQIPSAFDWVSFDYYELDSSAWTNPPIYYQKYLYPKMSAHQMALSVPGSYGSNVNPKFTLQQYENFMFQNAWAYYQWSLNDSRIIGINPWYYGPGSCGQPGFEISTYQMPVVLAMWQKIGKMIVNASTQRASTE